MVLDIEKIKNIILTSAKELNIDLNNCDFNCCNALLSKSETLRTFLAKSIGKSIKRVEMDSINNNLVQTIVELYIDQKDVEIEEETDFNLLDDNDNMPLDAFSLFMKDISYFSVPTKEEESELFNRFSKGDISAKQEIINRNQRLVVSIAKRFVLDDYDILSGIQDGNFGLMRAMEDFDITKGYKFSTYATWWIRHFITRSRDKNNHIIRISTKLQNDITRYNSYVNQFYLSNGYKPDMYEIAEGLNLSINRVKEIMNAPVASTSLNLALSDESDSEELGDMIADEKNSSPETEAIQYLLKRDLNDEMNQILSAREKEVLIYRFGLIDNSELTLNQVAKILGVTYERVRQIETRALRRLHYRSKKLELYIKD